MVYYYYKNTLFVKQILHFGESKGGERERERKLGVERE
jgi:hypothetical protein